MCESTVVPDLDPTAGDRVPIGPVRLKCCEYGTFSLCLDIADTVVALYLYLVKLLFLLSDVLFLLFCCCATSYGE